MDKDTTVFEIKVAGLNDFLNFINQLKAANVSLKEIAQAQQIGRAATQAYIDTQNKSVAASKAEAAANKTAAEALAQKAKAETDAQKATDAHNLSVARAENTQKSFALSLMNTNRLLGAMSAVIGVTGIGDFSARIFDAQSQIEALRLTLKNLLGDVAGANLFTQIREFTTRTPFTFEETIKSVNALVGSMKAAGIASGEIAKTVIPTLESLGNSASALGGGDRLGRLVYAFTQVQAAGRLMGTEVRQIAETGFPLLSVLSEKLGISVSEVRQKITDGAISFKIFKEAMLSAGQEGGVFAGSMAIMSQTVSGKIAILKDNVFFAMARVGEAFSGTAKKVIDFVTDLVNALTGTNFALQKTMDVVKSLIGTFVAYKVVTLSVIALEKVLLIIRGEAILANIALTGSQNVLTAAQTRAAASARTLNAALVANPWGLVVLAIGAVVTAMTLMREEQDKLKTETKEALIPLEGERVAFNSLANAVLKKTLSHEQELETLKKLKKEHPDLIGNTKTLAEAEKILNENKIKTNSAYAFREQKLEILKNQFPVQLKGINTLEEAEAKLGDVIRKTNIDFMLRGKLIENEVRTNFNNKIITDNLTEVISLESKLNKIRKDGISFVAGTAGNITKIAGTQEIAELQSQINKRRAIVADGLKKNENIEEQSFNTRKKLNYKYEQDTTEITNEGTKTKVDKTKKAQKEVEDLTKKHLDKLAKEEQDANKNILKTKNEIADNVRKLENSIRLQNLKLREEEELSMAKSEEDKLKIKKKYHELMWQEALRAWKESNKIAELEKKELEDFADREKKRFAVSVANNKDREVLLKAFNTRMDAITKDGVTKIEKEQQKSYETLSNAREKYNNGIITDEKALKKELEKLDKDNLKAQEKLLETIAEMEDKARILEKVAKAKNSREIIAIEIEEKNKIINEKKDRLAKELRLVDERLTQLEIAGKQETTEYKLVMAEKIRLETLTNEQIIEETKNLTAKKKDDLKTQVQDFRQAMNFIQDLSAGFFEVFDSMLSQSVKGTGDAVAQAQLENQKAGLQIAKNGMSAINDFANGNIIQGTFKALGVVVSLFEKSSKDAGRIAIAEMQMATEALQRYLDIVEVEVSAIIAKLDTIKNVYADIQTSNGGFIRDLVSDFQLQAALDSLLAIKGVLTELYVDPKFIKDLTGFGLADLIQGEIARGEKIQENYEKAITNAKNLFEKEKSDIEALYEKDKKGIEDVYNKEIESITKTYNAHIDAINKRYDYEQNKASQQYASQTLAIVANGTTQLEALITNEESLSSVRAEFAAKRLEIEKAFPLASKAITEGMSAAEVKAINDSIDARDKAFANLQSKYNEELLFIIGNEGQKRKEYSATELIQNEIRDKLELASIKFQADEIERIRKKNEDIKALEDARDLYISMKEDARDAEIQVKLDAKNALIKAKEESLAQYLITLEDTKNKAIADSFGILTNLLKNYSKEIEDALASSAAKGTDEYRKLEGELRAVLDLLNQIKGGNFTPTLPPDFVFPAFEPINVPRFDVGSDETNGKKKVDKKGGFFAVIHPKEQIYSQKQMDTLTKANGGVRPSREEVMQKFIGYTQMSKITTPNYNPWVIPKLPSNGRLEKEIRTLNRKMTKFADIVANSPKVINQIDKHGHSTYLVSKNKKVEIKRNHHRHLA